MNRSEPNQEPEENNLNADELVYGKELAILAYTEQIHALMEKSGVRKAELARRMGKSCAYVSRVLKGKRISFDEAVALAHALGWNFLPLLVENAKQVIEASAVAVSRGVLELPLVESVAKRLKPEPGITLIQ